ncbi:17734_t:CDS:2, partial [Gigaspora rosea]
ELQQLRIEQEKRVIKFNQIKDGIEQAILENIESLRDFQYWHQKILEATILTQQLQNNLNDLRLGRLEYWLKYTEEYNSFVKQIQNKTNLHKICKEHIRVLLDQQQKFNYQKIHDGILGETILTNLEVDKYWSKEIHQSSILTNNQRIELNNLCAKTLVTLTNRYYDEIKNEIPKITDTFLLEDKGEIDRRIQIANYDRIERLINTYARRLRVELLANESALAQSLNNLNQTLLGIEPDSECYDLIIQSIDEAFLDLLKTVQVLQNLRRDLYNSIQLSFDVKKINNLKDAFDWLNINKIEVETCLQEKQFLYNLKEKIIEIYSDEEKDHYFINIEEDIDIFNEDIENFIIKKNIIYKLIREIFKESGGIKNIVVLLTISSLLDLYIKVVDTNQEELKKIETIILTHLNNYPDITWFTFYKPTDKTNDFFKKAKYLTKQHYFDIVYRILVLRDLDLELDDIIENIFDGLEI